MSDYKESLIQILNNNQAEDLCTAIANAGSTMGCVGVPCACCPFFTEGAKAEFIKELTNATN